MDLFKTVIWYKEEALPHLTQTKEFYEKLELETAIEFASIGKEPNGKMHSHQRRVGYRKGMLGADELARKIEEIKRCTSFDDIFSITETVKKDIYRLGDLWSYDTALRIGFNLKIYPQQVYVQCGVVKGIKKVLSGRIPKERCVPTSIFPSELQELKAYEMENFLCIYGKDKEKVLC